MLDLLVAVMFAVAPPCPSDGGGALVCAWDASEHGDGRGHDFVAAGDLTFEVKADLTVRSDDRARAQYVMFEHWFDLTTYEQLDVCLTWQYGHDPLTEALTSRGLFDADLVWDFYTNHCRKEA